MGTGYTRNDTLNNIADGNIINASDLDGEFDAVESAFNESTGHTHDGTAAEGAPITVLGPVQDFIASATEIKPKTTNTLDIGTVSLQFKDMHLDGTAYIDGLGEDILVATDKKVQFRDTALFINSSVDGQLDIDADVELELVAPTIDIDASTALTVDTASTTFTSTLFNVTGSANITGDLDVDNININGNTISSTDTNGDITIDPDGTGDTIVASGNVGIGIASPDAEPRLHVHKGDAGSVTSATNSVLTLENNTTAVLQFLTPNTASQQIRFGDPQDTGAGYIQYNHSVNAIQFGTNGPEKMRIDSSGNVGIGTTSPSRLLSLNSSNASIDFSNGTWTNEIINSSGQMEFRADHTSAAASSVMTFSVDGSEAMRIDSSGNVGIGTTTPSYKVEIFEAGAGNTEFTGLAITNYDYGAGETGQAASIQGRVRNDGGGVSPLGKITFGKDSDYSSAANRDGNIQFSVNNSNSWNDAMRIISSGFVGIGTTSPAYKLVVSAGGASGIEFGPAYSGTANLVQHYSRSGAVYVDAINEAAQHRFYISGSEKMRLDSNGNLGIGTSAIAVAGPGTNVNIHSPAAQTTYLKLSNTSTGNGTGDGFDLICDASGGGYVWNREAANLYFATSNTEQMRMDSSGNLRIGTTTAQITSERVSIAGGLGISKDNQYPLGLIRGTNYGQIATFFNYSGTLVGSINVAASSTSYVTSSDSRLKDNITDADDAGSKIDAIQVRQFDWIADGSHQDYGMIAQELQTVAPEAVSGNPDGDEMMGVDYSKLVPMLIKEVQSLRARVAELENN